ncbi:MAG: GNAT family N-acetyltransferase [Candidatus Limnocylindrales bacterium]
MNAPRPAFRPAGPEELEAITALAIRSKRHWGYSDEFMEALGPELTFRQADLDDEHTRVEVIEAAGRLIGAIRMRRRTELAYLEDLWIDPTAIGHGYGRLGFERAVEIGREWGKGVLELEADPYAEAFYRHLGCVRVGMSPVATVPGRSVPVMRYAL